MIHQDDTKLIADFCNDIVNLNIKNPSNPDIFCAKTSVQNVYELDIKKYFSTLMYNITGKVMYMSLEKEKYLDLAKHINKIGIPLTKATSNLAHIIFSSVCETNNMRIMYRDTIDSCIVVSSKDLPDSLIYKSTIVGWNINVDVRVNSITLVYFNKFRNIRIKMYKNKKIISNTNINLDYDELLYLVNNKYRVVDDENLSLLVYLLRSCL